MERLRFEFGQRGMSALLELALRICRSAWRPMLLFQAALHAPTIALSDVFWTLSGAHVIELGRLRSLSLEHGVGAVSWALLAWCVGGLVSPVSASALARAIAGLGAGREIRASALFRDAFRLAPRALLLLGSSLLAGFFVLMVLSFFVAGAFACVHALGAESGQRMLWLLLASLVAAACASVSLAVLMALHLCLALAIPAMAVEDVSILRAVRSLRALLRGRFVVALALMLILAMISLGLSSLVRGFVPSPAFERFDVDAIVPMLPDLVRSQRLSMSISQVVSALTDVLSAAAWTLFYLGARRADPSPDGEASAGGPVTSG